MNVSTTFAGGQAKNEIDTGQGPQTKMLAVHPDAIVVNANLPLYPWTMLALRASLDTQQPQQFPIYVLGQAEVNATVVFKGREHVEFAGKSAELNHLAVTGSTPQGQPISLDFWVDDNRKLIKIAVPSQGVEAYQEGFEPKPRRRRPNRQAPKGIDRSKGPMGSPEIPLNSAAEQHAELPAALECYLSAILEIAETIEAISPEIAASFREPLTARCGPASRPIPLPRRSKKAATRCTKSCKAFAREPAARIRLWPAISIKRSAW